MAIAGHFEAFNPGNERITAYLERVKLFFVVNGIKEDKIVATFLSIIGGKPYDNLVEWLFSKQGQPPTYTLYLNLQIF